MQTGTDNGRLIARPTTKFPDSNPPTGLQPLGLTAERDGLLYVPLGYEGLKPASLAILLHGAGGNAEHGLWLLQSLADKNNMLLLAPPSRSNSWDIINFNRFGPDIVFINGALQKIFDRYAINTKRVAIGGFSDGASYALCVGLINGDLFTHILAFSPGFFYAPEERGRPKVFISHGTKDGILPIDHCSRRIVPKLKRKGYQVEYREFDGPHIIPPDISEEAINWFLGK